LEGKKTQFRVNVTVQDQLSNDDQLIVVEYTGYHNHAADPTTSTNETNSTFTDSITSDNTTTSAAASNETYETS
jgi:hypothetical protein